ncbi:basic phospholipase A2 caudoxin-like [Mizuhopecten yessoensis]|uniref:Phospholipase A2 n=1 Tax=Mizuhopecten yessoensis TaxID=6573 RepID=A0A210R5F9_MIZYE|nr:basic phospholipase A2 caudoxin-like [Mizuhopecten yessoensis]OWF56176.1 Basic phospholipase A2 caudoxin [Mizuhopecten yessoensis]
MTIKLESMLCCSAVILLFIFSCGEGAPREKRDLLQLVELLNEMTNMSGLAFNNYGCYCGWGGNGAPVDAVDRCCMLHDHCYGVVEACYPKWIHYKYQFATHPDRILQCIDKKNNCYKKTCECDTNLAKCVAVAHYHSKNKDMSQVSCYKTRAPPVPAGNPFTKQ